MGNNNTVDANTVIMDSLYNSDKNTKYKITSDKWGLSSSNMTYLMKLVMLTSEYPNMLEEIDDYVKANPTELDKTNHEGWTPLMLAIGNVTTCSSMETVLKLLELGACVNSKDIKYMSPLMVAAYNIGHGSNFETIQLLCAAPNININQTQCVYNKSTKSCVTLSALSYAINSPHRDINIINYMIKNGANLRFYEELTVIMLQNIYIMDTLNAIHTMDP